VLRIRKEQMDALRLEATGRFERRMLRHLRALFDRAAAMDETALRAWIGATIAAALRHGMDSERDARRYLESAMILGRDFDSSPRTAWAGEILRAAGLTGTEKMNAIEERRLALPEATEATLAAFGVRPGLGQAIEGE
jgi:hypothetical protein